MSLRDLPRNMQPQVRDLACCARRNDGTAVRPIAAQAPAARRRSYRAPRPMQNELSASSQPGLLTAGRCATSEVLTGLALGEELTDAEKSAYACTAAGAIWLLVAIIGRHPARATKRVLTATCDSSFAEAFLTLSVNSDARGSRRFRRRGLGQSLFGGLWCNCRLVDSGC